jgi:hypothetical protein
MGQEYPHPKKNAEYNSAAKAAKDAKDEKPQMTQRTKSRK